MAKAGHRVAATYRSGEVPADALGVQCDVTDPGQVEAAFATHRPTLVFHAAAYKHVPLAELNVLQAVSNNVFGTLNVAQVPLPAGVTPPLK